MAQSSALPWELRRRGLKDSLRHDQRVKEAIRKNLRELIVEEAIITSDGTRRVKIPLRYLDQYRFKYGQPSQGVGQGEGQPGDVLGQRGRDRNSPGDGQPGDQPGEHTYEVEVPLAELEQMMLEDLALPWLEEKPERQSTTTSHRFTDVRRSDSLANLDKRRTLLENIKRNAARGVRAVGHFHDADLRYKVWDTYEQHQHLYGTMGLSKIYEIVLNSDPGLAFLLDSNPEIANLLVAAHVFGHVDFFKNNLCFADTNRRTVNDAVAHALRIDAYIERYGLEVVEHLMDIGFALDRHTDPHKGLLRQPYPPRRVVEKEHVVLPYDDLMDTPTRSITYAVEGERLPPHPEHDLLWFLITYAPLEAWQCDVLQIMREESYYFCPQFNTKIMNEGWASYWHAELFHLYNGVSPHEMIEFARLHTGVVNPGGRYSINPYYLGYTMLVDIEKRWDQMHAAGETPLTGREKIFDVRRTEDDLSFLRNYLTADLVQRLNLFAYGSSCNHPPGKQCPQCQTVVITARERDAVVEALLASRYNYGVPRIVIQEVLNDTLCLEHLDRATTFLDRQYANNTLMYIAELWKHPVNLLTNDEDGRETTLTARSNT